jgi:hypothetical protein
MANDSKTGLLMRPLAVVNELFARYGQPLFQPPRDEIKDMPVGGWGSPLQPVKPMGPAGAEPRAYQFWPGQNLIFTPRPDAEYTAADLKALSTYPLARMCIENVKDILTSAPRQIALKPKPGEPKKAVAERAKGDQLLARLNKFWDRPDREHDWGEWLRVLVDDMLVGDWASVLLRKTFGGELVEAPRVAGEMIQRIVDKNGWTPLPPDPAYAQIWWGVPYVEMTTEQLVYKPRNIASRNTISSQLYGYSQTEQGAPEIEIGISRLLFVKAYYDEGSVPGVLQVVPRGTPTDKILEALTWMNSDLAGNFAKRRQIRPIQGWAENPKDENIVMTKEALLSDPFDELHIKRIAYLYGVSAQRLSKQMNRASSEQMDESAEMEGTRPYFVWAKSIVDFIVQVKQGLTDYELSIDPSREPDMKKQAETFTTYVKNCVYAPNEIRDKLGDDPDPNPNADKLGVITATGFVTLDQQQEAHDTEMTVKKNPPQPPALAAVGDKPDGGKPNGKPAAGKQPPKKDDEGAGDDGVKVLGFAAGVGTVARSTAADQPAVGRFERQLGGKTDRAAAQTVSRQTADLHEEYARKLLALGWAHVGGDSATRAYTNENKASHRIEVTVTPDGETSWVHTIGDAQAGDGFSVAGLVAHLKHGRMRKGAGALTLDGKSLEVTRKVSLHDTRRAVIHPGRLSPRSVSAKHSLEMTLRKNFARMQKKSVRLLRRIVGIASKAANPDLTVAEREMLNAIAADWERIADAAEKDLATAAAVGADLGLLQVDATSEDMIARVNETVRNYAERRAAEMVGMRRTADGDLVENPAARWAVSDTTRDRLRGVVADVFEMEKPTLADIEKMVMDAGIFDDQRATMIARTEIANAQVNANLLAWQESGMVESVSWQLSSDHDQDDVCDENEADSPYAIDEVPEFPAHPNCECALVLDRLVGEEEE